MCIRDRYKVEHYLQDLDGEGYTIAPDPNGTENKTGTTGAEAAFGQKVFTGFTYQSEKTTYEATGIAASTTKLTVAGDGSLIIKLYYDRNKHDVSYKVTGTVPVGAPTAPAGTKGVVYGTEVNVENALTFDGYTFSGWTTADADVKSGKFDMPDKDVVFTGSWQKGDNWYTVTYQANGGTGSVPKPEEYLAGTTVGVAGQGDLILEN